jgi:DNA-binding PadR family transcriptional regulator
MKGFDYNGLWKDAGELRQMVILSLLETPKTRYELGRNVGRDTPQVRYAVDNLEKRGFIKVDRDVVNKRKVYTRTEKGVRYMQEYFKRLSLSLKNISSSE